MWSSEILNSAIFTPSTFVLTLVIIVALVLASPVSMDVPPTLRSALILPVLVTWLTLFATFALFVCVVVEADWLFTVDELSSLLFPWIVLPEPGSTIAPELVSPAVTALVFAFVAAETEFVASPVVAVAPLVLPSIVDPSGKLYGAVVAGAGVGWSVCTVCC